MKNINFKKIASIIITILVTFSLFGCSGAKEEKVSAQVSKLDKLKEKGKIVPPITPKNTVKNASINVNLAPFIKNM